MFSARREEACTSPYANSASSPGPGKQTNLITTQSGRGRECRWGWRKTKLRRGEAEIKLPEIAMEEERMFPSVKHSSFRRKLLLAAK